ncbi:glycosyltransferase family 61 protein [Vibrio sp. 2-Bac 85]
MKKLKNVLKSFTLKTTKNSAMIYKEVSDAVVVPAINDFKGYGKFIHGVVDKDYGLSDDFLTITRGGVSLLKNNLRNEYLSEHCGSIEKIPGRYLYLGALPSHFGHLLAEGCHRMWGNASCIESFDGYVVLPDNENISKGQIQILKYFKINLEKIIYLKDVKEFETLILPQPGSTIGQNFSVPGYDNALKQSTKFNELKTEGLPKKLFVSRRNFKSVGRVAGFDFLSVILKKNGFIEFLPEEHVLEVQLAHLIAADEIIWEEGSAIHLLDILPKLESKMILLRRRPDYGEFDQIVKRKCTDQYIYNEVKFISSKKVPHNRMSRLTDIYSFFQFLREHGIKFEDTDFNALHREEMLDINDDQFVN